LIQLTKQLVYKTIHSEMNYAGQSEMTLDSDTNKRQYLISKTKTFLSQESKQEIGIISFLFIHNMSISYFFPE